MESKKIKILIADDHPMVREGLRHMLTVSGIKVVGEAASRAEALSMSKKHSPDVVLLDVKWPGNGGIDTLKQIKDEVPSVMVIMTTVYEEPEALGQSILNGASGFILKGATRQEVVNAVRTVAAGGAVFDLGLLVRLLRELGVEFLRKPGLTEEVVEKLTPMELGVLRMVAKGFTNKQIAQELRYSLGTVKDYVKKIIDKLGVANRAQDVAEAIRARLIK
jgi:DNA-binding NarL/FixJ family response regulator